MSKKPTDAWHLLKQHKMGMVIRFKDESGIEITPVWDQGRERWKYQSVLPDVCTDCQKKMDDQGEEWMAVKVMEMMGGGIGSFDE